MTYLLSMCECLTPQPISRLVYRRNGRSRYVRPTGYTVPLYRADIFSTELDWRA